jgi:hypothetical protein
MKNKYVRPVSMKKQFGFHKGPGVKVTPTRRLKATTQPLKASL